MIAKLTEAEIAAALPDAPGWTLNGDGIERTYRFADFVAAFGFMAWGRRQARGGGVTPPGDAICRGGASRPCRGLGVGWRGR